MRPLLSLTLLLGITSASVAAAPAATGTASGHARDGSTQAIPDLRFDLDLSHYIVAGEIGGSLSPEADRRFDVVMQRAGMLDWGPPDTRSSTSRAARCPTAGNRPSGCATWRSAPGTRR